MKINLPRRTNTNRHVQFQWKANLEKQKENTKRMKNLTTNSNRKR